MISTGGTTTLGLYDLKNPNAVQPINKGGTGATTAAAARANIGALTTGSYGLGFESQNISPETHDYLPNGFYAMNGYSGLYEYGSALRIVAEHPSLYAWQHTIFFPATVYGTPSISSRINGGGRSPFNEFLIKSRNATVDGNGFIKSASPVVDLYADHIEANDQAKNQQISFEKLGIGDYLIKNSTGLAQEGWYVEQPKDANGNMYHAVIYEQLENGDISVKTYEQKLEGTRIVADLTKPVDVKENRFISIRLNELPQDDTAPLNPTIVDNEGNAAPSKYHTLENGTWVISEVDSEKLEADKHKAYMDSLKPLTRRQFMRVLVLNGFDLDVIETHIQSIEDTQTRQLALIDWKEATEFRRNDETLSMVAGLVGLSEEQINVMWEQAVGV